MIVVVGSVRGSPGATSWSLLLAAAWPAGLAGERVVLEADPDGGVLGARHGLGVDPGVVSLLAAARHEPGVTVEDHGRRVGDVWLVPGPEAPGRARRVWSSSADALAMRVALDDRLWVVDVGRLNETNPSKAFVDAATFTLVVSSDRTEDLVALPDRLAALAASAVRLGVLVIGTAYPRPELVGFLGLRDVWTVRSSADLVPVSGQVLAVGRSRRSWVWREALEVAAAIADVALSPVPTGRGVS